LHVIGEDVSKRLDVVPAQLRVIETHRPKFACRSCENNGADDVAGVIQAPAPARLIVGGLPTEALVAQVVVSKHADHLPLYRQAQILARQGVEIERSTLAHWVGAAAAELQPLHDYLVRQLKASPKLFCDGTRCPVLDPGRGKTKTGFMWSLARDDRPWGGADPPAVAYTYAPGRGAVHAVKLLAGYSGILQVDGAHTGPARSQALPTLSERAARSRGHSCARSSQLLHQPWQVCAPLEVLSTRGAITPEERAEVRLRLNASLRHIPTR
jgi:transposase